MGAGMAEEWNWRGIDVINAHERDEAVYVEGIKAARCCRSVDELTATTVISSGRRLDLLRNDPELYWVRKANLVAF
jgi:hypothetical protein